MGARRAEDDQPSRIRAGAEIEPVSFRIFQCAFWIGSFCCNESAPLAHCGHENKPIRNDDSSVDCSHTCLAVPMKSSFLKSWRERFNLTQRDAANVLGVPYGTYRNWETRRRIPTAMAARAIAAGIAAHYSPNLPSSLIRTPYKKTLRRASTFNSVAAALGLETLSK